MNACEGRGGVSRIHNNELNSHSFIYCDNRHARKQMQCSGTIRDGWHCCEQIADRKMLVGGGGNNSSPLGEPRRYRLGLPLPSSALWLCPPASNEAALLRP